MADTPEQARVRAQLRERGNAVAPRVSTGSERTRTGTGGERRAAVKGAVEGSKAGPTGAAVGAVKARSKARKDASATTSAASSRPASTSARRTRSGGKSLTLRKLEGPQSGALFAEYFAGALIIVFALFTETKNAGYTATMSKVMMRLTALTAVFFVLFLMQGSRRGAQAAVWFGLLVDLGIVFTGAREQTFSTVASMVAGKPPKDTQTLGASTGPGASTSGITVPETPPPVQLPNE